MESEIDRLRSQIVEKDNIIKSQQKLIEFLNLSLEIASQKDASSANKSETIINSNKKRLQDSNYIKNCIYTDGSCLKSFPENPGGWAFIGNLNEEKVEKSGGMLNTTSNIMELQAVIEAFSLIKSKIAKLEDVITIYADSKYCVDGYNSWMKNWVKNDWKKADKTVVLNLSQWKQMWDFKQIFGKNVILEWVKGHADNKFNQEVDLLAKKAAKDAMEK